ncbi:hypothetical protein ACFCVY_18500 [Streptomyces sp. NPDC056411]|uniref:hypothetical protein n=1 Tax=Streptomyces sp. NPDC056411 TaxID=3345813 RepID=UPI0035DE36E7
MGEFPPCPPSARAAARVACGTPVELRQITHRRGAAVWRATGPDGVVAVKVGRGDGATATRREGHVLGSLGWSDYFLAAGGDHATAWVVTRWFTGPSTWQAFTSFRRGRGGQTHAVTASVELCGAVAALHASGWVHSDLQPAHGIHTAGGVRLIDCSWAWRAGLEPPAQFRGGITHLVAPELACSINAGVRPVTPSTAAEVYALAGSLWTCLTGRWPLDYAAAGIDPRRLSSEELRDRIADRRLPLDTATPWPAYQRILRPVLLARAEERPTAAELASEVSTLTS